MDKEAFDNLKANSDPFGTMEDFAKKFIINCRGFVIRFMILKNTEHMRNMHWRYEGHGEVTYTFDETIHHPAGFHMMGSMGGVDFASYSSWDEETRGSSTWNIVCNKHAIKVTDEDLADADYRNMIDFIDTIFSDRPVTYEWVAGTVMPKFNKIKKFW